AEGDAGDIDITTSSLELSNGGALVSGSDAVGDGGTININATESVLISGIDSEILDSGIFSTTEANAIGNAGGINLTTPSLSLRDLGEISVDSEGQGNSGTLAITADEISLDTGASITAATQSGTGGEIDLQVSNNLTLENDSRISAQAFNQADGGNININAEFILAFPPNVEGNDIIASAEAGAGGNITIGTEQIFGLNAGTATPGNRRNDLDVSSDLGLQGTLAINRTNVDVSQGIIELTNNTVTPEETVAKACSTDANVADASSFIVQGKGGVPDVPTAPLSADSLLIETESTEVSDDEPNLNRNLDLKPFTVATAQGEILPARGVVIGEDGKVTLTPYPVSKNSVRTPHSDNNCQ
ncbi:MAG TPA: filamentous hemagglutinin, partial [Xenococcaceae cyanobacterium]